MAKRVCIVGYGSIGPIHARALERIEGAVLTAVCDIDADRRAACAARYGVKEYADFDRMLEESGIDTVHICTPHYLHFPMIKKALAAGKAVVTEKPVTHLREDFVRLQALKGAERVCVVFQNRYNPCVQKLKEIVDKKTLGEARGVRAVLTWQRDRAYYESGAWRGRWETEGGGLLINQAIHTLDYFCYLFGRPKTVKAHMSRDALADVIEVEDTLSARMEFEQGVIGVFYATNGYAESSAPFFEVLFDKGMVRYLDGMLYVDGKLAAADVPAHAGKAYWGSGHETLLEKYYDAGEFFTVSDAAATMETMFDLYDAAREGKF